MQKVLAGVLQLGDKVLHNHFGTPTTVTIVSLWGRSAQDPERGNGWFTVKGARGFDYQIDGNGWWDAAEITDTTEVVAELAPRGEDGFTDETRWEAGRFGRNMNYEAHNEAVARGGF